MSITRETPRPEELTGVLATLLEWQRESAPVALHPGDLGWFWRFGRARRPGRR